MSSAEPKRQSSASRKTFHNSLTEQQWNTNYLRVCELAHRRKRRGVVALSKSEAIMLVCIDQPKLVIPARHRFHVLPLAVASMLPWTLGASEFAAQ